jgi:RNA polymerase sigma-70 factor (ECF subfamily)
LATDAVLAGDRELPDGTLPDGTVPDRELIARHVGGDPDAFGQLFARHRDRLWAVALRTLGDPEEAADALQDAMVSAFRRADSYRGEAAVTTWLHRVVVNACLDRIRRSAVRAADPLPDDDRSTGVAERRDPIEARQTAMDVEAALATLPVEQRAALVLVDMQGYSVDEVARILDVAPGTVKSRCARGRAKLLPLLTQYGGARVTQYGGAEGGGNRGASHGVPPPATDRLADEVPDRRDGQPDGRGRGNAQ